MTEEECNRLLSRQLQRKRRLFALAVVRSIPRFQDFSGALIGIAHVETFADLEEPTLKDIRRLKALRLKTERLLRELQRVGDADVILENSCWLFCSAAASNLENDFFAWANYLLWHEPDNSPIESVDVLYEILCEILGNPFRPVAFDPRWRSESAVALASAIYAERAFDRMPILADALEEGGCDHPDVLYHCRDPQQVHARGCWVVDLVLGKS